LHPSLVFSSHIQNLPLFSPHLLLLLVSASRNHTPQKIHKTHKETMELQFLVFVFWFLSKMLEATVIAKLSVPCCHVQGMKGA
jgi:hypothetical protein